jgi:PTS system glucose-specific IIA component
MKNGVELLVHIGIDTVNAKGDGFRLLGKKQDSPIKAGEPVVEVNLKKLSKKYDMPVMLIVTNANDQAITFRSPCNVKRGESVIQ